MSDLPVFRAMTPAELIHAIGGRKRVAELCSAAPTTVSNWRHRGFPLWTYDILQNWCADNLVRYDRRLFAPKPRGRGANAIPCGGTPSPAGGEVRVRRRHDRVPRTGKQR